MKRALHLGFFAGNLLVALLTLPLPGHAQSPGQHDPVVLLPDGRAVFLTPEMEKAGEEKATRYYGLLAAGFDLLKQKKASEALSCFQEAQKLGGPDASLSRGLIKAYLMKGDSDAALQEYRRMIYAGGSEKAGRLAGSSEEQLALAILLNEKKQWKEAVAVYEKAVEGLSENVKGDLSALVPIAFAVPFDPEFPRYSVFDQSARLARGIALMTSANPNPAEAEQEFAAVLKVNPRSAVAWYYRALNYGRPFFVADDGERAKKVRDSLQHAWDNANPREERAMTPVLQRRGLYEAVTGRSNP